MDGLPEGLFRRTGFLIPCILLMLQADHRESEELRELIEAFGFPRQAEALTLGWVLDRLEAASLIQAVSPPAGHTQPITRYRLTADGHRWLEAHSEALAGPGRLVQRFLARYAAAKASAADHPRMAGEDWIPVVDRMWRR